MSEIDLLKTFRDEAQERLGEMEEALLDLELAPDNAECVNSAFRAMHTIKGSAAMFGFDEIARFMHDLETVFDRVRSGRLPVTKDLLTMALAAKDHIHKLLGFGDKKVSSPDVSTKLMSQFKMFLGETDPGLETKTEHSPEDNDDRRPHAKGKGETYWIRYKPSSDSFMTGTDPLNLLDELAGLGTMREVFYPDSIPHLDEIDPETAFGMWDIVLCTDRGEEAIGDVFIFVMGDHDVRIRKIGDGIVRASDLEDLLDVFDTRKDESALLTALTGAFGVRTHWRGAGTKKPETPDHAEAARASGVSCSTSIRIDSTRLDRLVDMVGELVIIQSRLAQAVRGNRDPVLERISEDMERLMDEMRESAIGIRMLPISTAFGALNRLVRDLCVSLGKEVQIVTEGGDTELDKTVIDRLKDPLMHILRNCMDHGIEESHVRAAAGKPPKGTIRLTAAYSGSEVVLTVADDGAGIDPEKVRKKAEERGLIPAGAPLCEAETYGLLFEPGFSTAEKVSDVSGRGVGMDMVKKSINSLRGAVKIDSQKGWGTTLRIRLPLTLAILDGLMVRIGAESFILPLASVKACQERFVDGEVKTVTVMERMGKMIPCISLRKMLEVPGEQPGYERIVIASVDGVNVGLAVDSVVGRQQAVIKSLAGIYKNLDWISGTTINGDGGISLILDVRPIVRFAASLADVAGGCWFHSSLAAISATLDRSPFTRVMWPDISSLFNFSTRYESPLLLASR